MLQWAVLAIVVGGLGSGTGGSARTGGLAQKYAGWHVGKVGPEVRRVACGEAALAGAKTGQ